MKKKFSTKWKASKQPRKQRKYRAEAPLHIRRKFLSVNLSKELRKKHEKQSIVVRKGDKVKVLRGKYKKKTGKILKVFTRRGRVEIEGIQIKKLDGSKVNVKLQPSNLQIIELYLEDKRRLGKTQKSKISGATKSGAVPTHRQHKDLVGKEKPKSKDSTKKVQEEKK